MAEDGVGMGRKKWKMEKILPKAAALAPPAQLYLCPPNLLMGPELVLIPTKRWLPHLGKVHDTLIQNQLPHLCVLLAKSPQECCYIKVCT